MYIGGAINESTDLDIEVRRHLGATWASVRRYSSELYDRRNARLSAKIRLFKAELVEALLYRRATWTIRTRDFGSLRTAHYKLLLRVIVFRRKNLYLVQISLPRTDSREDRLRTRRNDFSEASTWVRGVLIRQGGSRLSK